MTLTELSELTKVSPAFLSLVERGKSVPSLSTLARISTTLGRPVSAFLEVGLPPDAVTRAGERPLFSIGKSPVKYERLSTVFPGQQVDAVIMHVPAGYRSQIVTNVGEEWLYILSGELHQTVDETTVVLRVGDTCHFRGDSPHSYHNKGKEPVRILWAGTVSVFK